jgi:hypothetical protein
MYSTQETIKPYQNFVLKRKKGFVENLERGLSSLLLVLHAF